MGRHANRIISGSLSASGINQIIDGLRKYSMGLKDATELFVRRLSEEGYDTAQIYISEASPTRQDDGTADYDKPVGTLTYKTDSAGFITSMRLIFSGQQVLFVEFGSGFYFNTAENPWSSEFGMGVGTFPHQTHANDPQGWSYFGNDDTWHHTHGIKATMPMYHASQAVRHKDTVLRIAKEVFGSVI